MIALRPSCGPRTRPGRPASGPLESRPVPFDSITARSPRQSGAFRQTAVRADAAPVARQEPLDEMNGFERCGSVRCRSSSADLAATARYLLFFATWNRTMSAPLMTHAVGARATSALLIV